MEEYYNNKIKDLENKIKEQDNIITNMNQTNSLLVDLTIHGDSLNEFELIKKAMENLAMIEQKLIKRQS